MDVKAPRGQEVQHLIYGHGNILKYVITSDARQDRWYLYEVDNNGVMNKVETGKSPMFKRLEKREG